MSGFSPYRKKKSFTLTAIILILAAFFSFSAYKNIYGVRPLLITLLYPVQFITISTWNGTTSIPARIMHLRKLAAENESLKSELESLRPKLLELDELARENNRFKSILSFQQNNLYGARLLPCQIISRNMAPWFSIVEVNRGINAGVKLSAPVVNKDGLVGQIVEVTPFTSKVMLIIDPQCSVAVLDERSRDNGIAVGLGNKVVMEFVSSSCDIAVNDRIITSNISTLFTAGIPIGQVTRAVKKENDLFYRIEIKPAVDFSKLEQAFIVLP